MADDFDAMASDLAGEDGEFADEAEWPNCPTPDCEFKVNLWAGVGLCSPCSERVVGRKEMQRRYWSTRVSATDRRWAGVPAV